MNFRIQASQPKNTSEFCTEDKKVSEAIETVFPMMTEDALLIWNTSYIPLNYKYDISYMVEDIINMLRHIRENSSADMTINWPTNTFACNWVLFWKNEMLTINSRWRYESGRSYDELSEINIDIHDFTYEWKMLLKVIIENLELCGYSKSNLLDMNIVYQEFQLIKCYGSLYR